VRPPPDAQRPTTPKRGRRVRTDPSGKPERPRPKPRPEAAGALAPSLGPGRSQGPGAAGAAGPPVAFFGAGNARRVAPLATGHFKVVSAFNLPSPYGRLAEPRATASLPPLTRSTESERPPPRRRPNMSDPNTLHVCGRNSDS
jgi:hypothetical protein